MARLKSCFNSFITFQLFDYTYPEEKCFCCECSQKKGQRTKKDFKKVYLPDYSELFSPKLWIVVFAESNKNNNKKKAS